MAKQGSNPQKILSKQKKLYAGLAAGGVVIVGAILLLSNTSSSPSNKKPPEVNSFELPSKTVKAENVRLTSLEVFNDALNERLHSLEKSVLNLNEDKSILEKEKETLSQETAILKVKLDALEEERAADRLQFLAKLQNPTKEPTSTLEQGLQFKEWGAKEKKNDRNILFEIPAGTVVKAVLISGADCSVGVQKPTGPNMVLLRPLANGKLPKKLQVPLKGSVIIGNGIGDISSERVYIRTERMTLVERNGDFIETEISAYISGEDGREGMRGIVVDRSGSIITRAGFAAFLQGAAQGVQATLNNQTLEKLARVSSQQSILNLDLARNSGFQGGTTALNKLADYYIKRAEQLQPTIQIAAGRIVDIVFTKTVKIGETDLKKKFELERSSKMKG